MKKNKEFSFLSMIAGLIAFFLAYWIFSLFTGDSGVIPTPTPTAIISPSPAHTQSQ